jgi:hypothetical protein
VPQDLIANLEALLAKGNDAPSLRFALATRYLGAGDAAAAVRHAEAAGRARRDVLAGWECWASIAAGGDESGAATAFRRGSKPPMRAATARPREMHSCAASRSARAARRPTKARLGPRRAGAVSQ